MRQYLRKIIYGYPGLIIGLLLQLLTVKPWAGESENYYVFYRGYHFLANQEINPAIWDQKGISSRPVSDHTIAENDLEKTVNKVYSLNRSWTAEEKQSFKPSCATPYQELVQLYTNSYIKFVAELSDATSRTRRILNLVDLTTITSNLFVSTSLKAEQAYRYGAGLKLYSHENLRRYPSYTRDTFIPQNAIIGYVDVIAIPAKEIETLGAFFVVDSFAIACTKLSHYIKKNLTEELEVIFPFHIPAKYHVHRIPIRLPNLIAGKRNAGLNGKKWRENITQAVHLEDQKEVEERLVVSLMKHAAKDRTSQTDAFLKQNNRIRVSNGPSLTGLGKTLVPAEAVAIRKEIIEHVTTIEHQYFDQGNKQFNIPVQALTFAWSHALKKIATRGYGVNLTANFSMKSLNQELMKIFIGNDNITNLNFRGDPHITADLYEEFKNTDFRNDQEVRKMDTLWLLPDTELIEKFEALSKGRKKALTLDVTGLALAPQYFDQAQYAEQINLIDNERKDLDEAYNLINDGAFWWRGYCIEML
ncbi:hypothetical protein [Candidatus Odyssella thessalonicensis]|uniref:hypothetical protein n=1 Tax=Candidatus Odyssella thessalonicensis TaxID=84647 RepID=UPI000225ABC8|nr:hypothetical protein [Candidatus Odyssella thessalonicensis]